MVSVLKQSVNIQTISRVVRMEVARPSRLRTYRLLLDSAAAPAMKTYAPPHSTKGIGLFIGI